MSPILSQRGFLFQLVLAMHHTSTLCAPASSNVRASADALAPVVTTSSTMAMVC
jgi:hypothetical protein